MVHEVAADLIGAVGEARGAGGIRRSQQDRSRVHRSRGQDHDPGRHLPRFPRLPYVDCGDASTPGRGFQALDPRAGLDADIVVRERLLQCARLRVHLARSGVGVTVPRGPSSLQPAVDVDTEGEGERMQSLPLQPFANARDRRFVGDRRMRVRRRMGRLGRILTEAPAHPVERLRPAVPRLQLLVGKGPCRRHAPRVRPRLEVLAPEAEQRGPVHLRVAADEVEVAGVEGSSVPVPPLLPRAEPVLHEDGPGRALAVTGLDPVAALQDQDRGSGVRQPRRDRRAAHAGAYDDDVR